MVGEGVVGEGVVGRCGRRRCGRRRCGRRRCEWSGGRESGCLRCYIFVVFVFPIRQGSKF